mmetsp:Transcript_7696/g.14775  ORF Transcript_7696/g.14775 Transcript_7696/m.14775 type:complete len:207 (+) Transcript_7696:1328-1948(+)
MSLTAKLIQLLRTTEISKLDGPLVVQQDIFSFDVAMNNPVGMKIFEPLEDLLCHRPHRWDGKGVEFLGDLGQCALWHVLHEHVQHVVVGQELRTQIAHDVLVPEPLHEVEFRLKHFQIFGCGIAAEFNGFCRHKLAIGQQPQIHRPKGTFAQDVSTFPALEILVRVFLVTQVIIVCHKCRWLLLLLLLLFLFLVVSLLQLWGCQEC